MTGVATEPQSGSTSALEGAPYPGPRPFQEHEGDLFFGRARERSQLRSLVLANSLVLLYAQSGAGKTSLIQAGLIPSLAERGATVFPVLHIRPAGEENLDPAIENPYVRSIVTNWAGTINEKVPAVGNFSGFMDLLARRHQATPDDPRVAIIDQFEELFTSFPEYWEVRGAFFAELADALEADANLRILLAMREDYIPQTDPYAGLVPNHLQQRLRIETLRREQALLAVTGPIERTPRRFAPGAADYLVGQLLQMRVERNGKIEKIQGAYVEPVQLQVVCQRLWEQLPDRLTEITENDVRAAGDVDEVLASFYDEAVRSAASRDLHAREARIRQWIQKSLVTSLETRGTAHREAALKAGVPLPALEELVNKHLLRSEWRNGSDWFELTHDRLIGPIVASNRRHAQRRRDRRWSWAATAGAVAVAVVATILAKPILGSSTSPSSAQLRTLSAEATAKAVVRLTRFFPLPPVITVPARNRLYQQGTMVTARFACLRAAATAITRCVGNVPAGLGINTFALGPHRFTVTATFADGVATATTVGYTVVAYPVAAYDGHAVAINYPSGWRIEAAEVPKPGYTDTTIVSPSDPNTLLRVDVTPRPRNLLQSARSEAALFAHVNGYRLLGIDTVPFQAGSAIRWRFETPSGGEMVRVDDEFINDYAHGKSIAVLTQAPVGSYGALTREFADLRGSLLVK